MMNIVKILLVSLFLLPANVQADEKWDKFVREQMTPPSSLLKGASCHHLFRASSSKTDKSLVGFRGKESFQEKEVRRKEETSCDMRWKNGVKQMEDSEAPPTADPKQAPSAPEIKPASVALPAPQGQEDYEDGRNQYGGANEKFF